MAEQSTRTAEENVRSQQLGFSYEEPWKVCPKCESKIEYKSFIEAKHYFDVDPVTGLIASEPNWEDNEGDEIDYKYYCTADECDWEVWKDEDPGPVEWAKEESDEEESKEMEEVA